jgi:hypothetical protein
MDFLLVTIDLLMVIEDIRQEGDSVAVISHCTGTFTNDLDLSAMGKVFLPCRFRYNAHINIILT